MPEVIEERLSYLGFRLIEPPPALRGLVKEFWVMHSEQPLTGYHEEFMHPGGDFGIMFNLGDGPQLGGEPLPERMFLDGANSVSYRMGFTGSVHALGVRLHAGGAFPVFGVPLHELANQMVPLDALDAQTPTLLEHLHEAPSLSARIDAITQWLLKRTGGGAEHLPIVSESLGLIKRNQGQVQMARLADYLYISQRQLERLYQTHVGITPKQYASLLRVASARDALKKPQARSIAELGASLGYYDQSHFIREFKSVVGMTPARYMARHMARTVDE